MPKKKTPGPKVKPGPRPGNRILQDPEKRDQIIYWIGECLVSRNDCAKRLGIDDQTIRKEMDLDPAFGERVRKAENDARDELVGFARNHAKLKDWRAVQFLLQCKYWAEFSKKDHTFTIQDFQMFALKMSDLVRKYVPEDAQLNFAGEVSDIIEKIEKQKRYEEDVAARRK
jgi:hypothetical protein